jgi:hypothetical protein
VQSDRLRLRRARSSWFNPRSGERGPGQNLELKPVVTFSRPEPPRRGNDWVLIIETRA